MSANPSRSNTLATKSRTLVLCFDGTSNEYDSTNTNVVKLFSALQKNNPDSQLCYYQAGVGTYFKPGVVSPLFAWLAKMADEAVAWYLDQHIMEGYTFLMQNYRDGDKICLFGFSRGAYTARALAGMVHKVGLLGRDNPEQVPFAYKLYSKSGPEGDRLSAGFKQAFARDVKVEFVGVWDTVASVGVIVGKSLPFTGSNSAVKTFRHALSLDERRARFQPNLFHRPSPNPSKDPQHASPILSHVPDSIDFKLADGLTPKPDLAKEASLKLKHKSWSGRTYRLSNGTNGSTTRVASTATGADEETSNEPDVLEVWFAGCHSDVGGGSTPDTSELSLSQITLHWMIREVIDSQCGILFNDDALERNRIDLKRFPVTQEVATDKIDATQPLYDALKIARMWWILEILPLQLSFQDGKGFWHNYWGWHLGRGRKIPDYGPGNGPRIHITVRDRMNDAKLKYKPKASWATGTEVYVR